MATHATLVDKGYPGAREPRYSARRVLRRAQRGLEGGDTKMMTIDLPTVDEIALDLDGGDNDDSNGATETA